MKSTIKGHDCGCRASLSQADSETEICHVAPYELDSGEGNTLVLFALHAGREPGTWQIESIGRRCRANIGDNGFDALAPMLIRLSDGSMLSWPRGLLLASQR